MAPYKMAGPSPVLTSAGIELDCLEMEARLPKENVEKTLNTIRCLLPRKRVQLKELQSLVGLLNFACSAITSGQVLSRRLINLTVGVKRAHHRIQLTLEMKKDLRIWQTFL